jgi:hypothetical protein
MSLMFKILACILALSTASCATLSGNLPNIIAYVQDGEFILNSISRFVDLFFRTSPNTDLQLKIEKVMDQARTALDLALRAASGGQKLDQKQVDAAFEEFKKAYADLLILVAPLGVRTSTDGSFRGTPIGLLVPAPMALKR